MLSPTGQPFAGGYGSCVDPVTPVEVFLTGVAEVSLTAMMRMDGGCFPCGFLDLVARSSCQEISPAPCVRRLFAEDMGRHTQDEGVFCVFFDRNTLAANTRTV